MELVHPPQLHDYHSTPRILRHYIQGSCPKKVTLRTSEASEHHIRKNTLTSDLTEESQKYCGGREMFENFVDTY